MLKASFVGRRSVWGEEKAVCGAEQPVCQQPVLSQGRKPLGIQAARALNCDTKCLTSTSARVSYAYDKTFLVNTWVVCLRAWDSWVSFNLWPLVCKPFLCKSQITPQHKKFVEHSVILSFEHKFFHSLCYSGANALLLLVFWFTLFKVTLGTDAQKWSGTPLPPVLNL